MKSNSVTRHVIKRNALGLLGSGRCTMWTREMKRNATGLARGERTGSQSTIYDLSHSDLEGDAILKLRHTSNGRQAKREDAVVSAVLLRSWEKNTYNLAGIEVEESVLAKPYEWLPIKTT